VTTQTKTQGQQYHEEVEALKAKGQSNAEAVRAVAATHGKSISAIRGSLYQHATRLSGHGTAPRRSRRAVRSVEDHLTSARQSLEAALALIDHEITEAAAGRDAAQARYDELAASAETRKAEIKERLKALS
jgi:chromosome segregation ATPase